MESNYTEEHQAPNFSCAKCSKTQPEDDEDRYVFIYTDEEPAMLCHTCVSKRTKVCPRCERRTYREYLLEINGEQVACTHCQNEEGFIVICDTLIPPEYIYTCTKEGYQFFLPGTFDALGIKRHTLTKTKKEKLPIYFQGHRGPMNLDAACEYVEQLLNPPPKGELTRENYTPPSMQEAS